MKNIPGAKIKCVVKFDESLKKDIELGGKKDYPWDWNFDKDDKEQIWDPDFLYINIFEDKEKIEEKMTLIDFEKLALKFYKSNETEIALDMTDDSTWTQAKRDGKFYSPEFNKNITSKAKGYVCCSFSTTLKKFGKNYYVFLDIDNWTAANFDNKFLIKKNPEPIYIKVEIIDNNTDDLLLERWYNIENFKKAEPEALIFILKSFQNIKPLS